MDNQRGTLWHRPSPHATRVHSQQGAAMTFTRRLVYPLLVLAVAMLAVAMGTRQVSADPRNFTFINASPITIIDVYVTASNTTDWGDDILGRDVLFSGEEVDILFSRFDGEAGQCLYDILVRGENGEEGYLYGVNLCETTSVTYY